MCPGLVEQPSSQSELDSADQFLKFCDDTPSAATPRTLKIHRIRSRLFGDQISGSMNSGTLERSYVNGAQALHPAGIRSRCSRYGELPAVNLIRVRSHGNKHFILAPGCTNTRAVLPSFETATEASSDRLCWLS